MLCKNVAVHYILLRLRRRQLELEQLAFLLQRREEVLHWRRRLQQQLGLPLGQLRHKQLLQERRKVGLERRLLRRREEGEEPSRLVRN